MSEGPWVEYRTPDGDAGRLPSARIEVVMKWIEGDLGTIHTTRGEVIKVVNVAAVLAQLPAPAEIPVVRRRAPAPPPARRPRRPSIAAVRAAFALSPARRTASSSP